MPKVNPKAQKNSKSEIEEAESGTREDFLG
jgi:hypothetical protein